MTGRKLSHYDILESLGAGGMGEVYRAHDTRLGRDVAIKILPSDRPLNDTARRRFQHEAMAASQLNHPNIITIYEINSDDGTDFIVMEYVRGRTLHSLVKQTRLSVNEVLRYATQIADAVAKAHSVGIIHRDIKPGNVMITDDGLVKVLDFGLAKFDRSLQGETDDRESETVQRDAPLSVIGSVSGTLAYMSPEQARGDPVDFRSDIFSFGIVLFQSLSGELPFPAASQLALLHNLHFNPPRDLSSLRPELPDALVNLILRTLEKDPAARIQSMAEVANELKRIAREIDFSSSQEFAKSTPVVSAKGSVRPSSAWYRSRVVLAAGCLLLILAVGIGLREEAKRSSKNAHPAQPAQAVEPTDEGDAYVSYKKAREVLDHLDRDESSDRAIKFLERAVQLNPQSAASYAALAEAYYRKNQSNPDPQWTKLSSDYARSALSLDNDLSASHIAAGLADMQDAHTAEAEKQFRQALALEPKSSTPHRYLGILYDKTNKYEESRQELQRAIELDPQDWKIYMELGFNRYLSADFQAAAANWEHALKLEPDNVDALRDLGAVYHMLDRDDDAATVLQRVLEIEPNAAAYNNLGTIRYYQGHYEEAKNAFEKTVALNANAYDSWGNLADSYRWTPGYRAKSIQVYAHAIQLIREELAKTPDDLDMRATLATYLAKIGDKAGALQELKPVAQAKKKEALTWFRSSVVYELCGDRARALEALAAALKAGQNLTEVKNEPELVSLRADPRYHLNVLGSTAGKTGR